VILIWGTAFAPGPFGALPLMVNFEQVHQDLIRQRQTQVGVLAPAVALEKLVTHLQET
jgi:hypothetical protein